MSLQREIAQDWSINKSNKMAMQPLRVQRYYKKSIYANLIAKNTRKDANCRKNATKRDDEARRNSGESKTGER